MRMRLVFATLMIALLGLLATSSYSSTVLSDEESKSIRGGHYCHGHDANCYHRWCGTHDLCDGKKCFPLVNPCPESLTSDWVNDVLDHNGSLHYLISMRTCGDKYNCDCPFPYKCVQGSWSGVQDIFTWCDF
jgi:hypothetical protein